MHAGASEAEGRGATLVGGLQRDLLPAVGLIEDDGLDLLQVSVVGPRPDDDLVGRVAFVQLVVQPHRHRGQRHLPLQSFRA